MKFICTDCQRIKTIKRPLAWFLESSGGALSLCYKCRRITFMKKIPFIKVKSYRVKTYEEFITSNELFDNAYPKET